MSLNICSEKHEEICYEGRKCPVCNLVEKIDLLEDEITDLMRQIESLQE